jgi:hypothetical protein
MILNRIDAIEEALYSGESSYIEPIFEMLIRFMESLDNEDLYVNNCQSRIEEAYMWWEHIPDDGEKDDSLL